VGVERARQTLCRADRLRDSRDFQRISRRGQRVSSGRFVVLVAPRATGPSGSAGPGPGSASGSGGRVGLTVSRRVGGAVVRNRVKRRLREWFRRSGVRGAGDHDWVVIARPPAAGLSSPTLRTELDGLCRRALEAAA